MNPAISSTMKTDIRKSRGNKKGFVLVITMVFMSLLLMGGSSYLYMTTSESKQTERQADSEKAFYLANSGIERACWRIKIIIY